MINVIPGRSGNPIENRVLLPTHQLQLPTMPPIRAESRQKLANQEGNILLALDDIKNGRIKSIRAAARLFGVPESTLRNRAHGVDSRVDIRPNGHKLTQLEKDSLTT